MRKETKESFCVPLNMSSQNVKLAMKGRNGGMYRVN